MSHHSSEHPMQPEDEQAKLEAEKRLHQLMGKLLGEFPDGKLNHSDEGAIALSVGLEGGKIVIRFPKPVSWVGFTHVEAIQIAQSLIDCSKKISNSPFSLRV